ncbi:hypothetical protein [Pseudomonas sp. NCCP-436]|uniref:hypothetical protein n=1 Tax=Pseudomonas sp. NCCP-436 TaxID=2842481 RepID=UPI001C803792|nr:hypothetical protein [Pseudomonas sp. NCCP-436]GIZ10600.1 hypothetical protein NCCP436_00160 [Pseudomonas sp. NCCP-436]
MSQTHLLLRLADTDTRQQITRLLDSQAPHCQVINDIQDCQHMPLCRWIRPLPSTSLGTLQASLDDAIEVLERSRHAFKSAQLAELRKRLCQVREELSSLGNCGKT